MRHRGVPPASSRHVLSRDPEGFFAVFFIKEAVDG